MLCIFTMPHVRTICLLWWTANFSEIPVGWMKFVFSILVAAAILEMLVLEDTMHS